MLRSLRCFSLASLCLLFSAVVAGQASAQASRTAGKTADISAFAGVEIANPEYGPTNNSGVALGADFTSYFRHLPVQPSLEIRANLNYGTYVDQKSLLFGLKAGYQFLRLDPYVDFLIGPGDVDYPLNVGYTSDNSVVFDYGGGVDVDLLRNFSLKLDVQGQRWNTGTYAFTPAVGIIGLTYHIPFRSQVGYGGR